MAILIQGLSLKNYRGIGPIVQRAAPLKGCNFFIGTNNSGKSSFLNFVALHLSDSLKTNGSQQLSFKPLEIHLGATTGQVEIGFALPLADALELTQSRLARDVLNPKGTEYKTLEKLLRALSEDGLVWVKKSAVNLRAYAFEKFTVSEIKAKLNVDEWYKLWRSMTRQANGDIDTHWIPEVIDIILSLLRFDVPEAKIIPAKRQIGKSGENFDDFSGTGLIDKLAALQNPGPTERHLRKNFEKINLFLQEVTGDNSSEIEIPHDRTEVLVHKEKRVLPLSSLGTGIHEVVMIAAFCTLTENSIVCIEEPEIHLHPLLQKKLVKYIIEQTNNQYFIATHSPSIIDHEGASVFHVLQKDNTTHVELAAATQKRFEICRDLGYKASDLLQTNAIVWVEGPSDRIYLKHWITAIDPNLLEGIHYSIMYYGGRLLSHLSADDEIIDDFISLRALNRNMAIVIDSDRKNANSKINETKKRIINDFEKHGDNAWLTAGREIENYIDEPTLNSALIKIYPKFSHVESNDRFAHRLHFFQNTKPPKLICDVDKVKIARTVCQSSANFSILDLKKQVAKIVSMIRGANMH